jgi:diaminohydroxyphosphoribosylaminopyrimidine deaminase/5-amino-6-(5-phosphoribosylamino)uracil reductase
LYAAREPGERHVALRERAEVVVLPNTAGKVDLTAMLRDLGRRSINELHVEAGHKLNGSFVKEALVDELLIYLAPRLLGHGRDMAALPPLTRLEDGLPFVWHDISNAGGDLRLRARRRPS